MKKLKSKVQFEHPAKGSQHCSQCLYWIRTRRECELVSGSIQPGDWCKLFEPLKRFLNA